VCAGAGLSIAQQGRMGEPPCRGLPRHEGGRVAGGGAELGWGDRRRADEATIEDDLIAIP
jgi:hypothetical protein